MEEIAKSYTAKDHETHIYDLWTRHRAFEPTGTGEPFSMLMPPPNANESLHVGHAEVVALEDAMTRFARMQGKNTLWIPGTDHAGFETQVVYEKKLQKEDKSRFDFTPEELRSQIRSYVGEQQETILSQLKRLGASCDWNKLYFTLDKNITDTVYATFTKMYNDGLLYRAKRLVNYCTKHGTSFSDLEVQYEDREGTLYYITFPLADNKSEFITVATTRPETMLGDVAIAVNPNDVRYQKFVGKNVIVPLTSRSIPVIADELAQPEFGTGAVKVTSAHSHQDHELVERHHLPIIQVIDTRGKMMGEIPAKYVGIKSAQARDLIVADLTEAQLLAKTEKHMHRVGVCYKCKTPIEILPLDQWWVKTKPLAEKAIAALKNGQIRVTPRESADHLITWLENIIDWNISRQIVWGIPIPAWFNEAGEIKIQAESPGSEWKADPDTFDTWFSSTQLPYAVLGYPHGDDYKTFFPTSVMETARDILYFWVGRMIMMSLYTTGEVPFKHIYLHGLVTDASGKKMSKSKGNVTDPLEVMETYGTDALRWAVVHGTSPGQNFSMSPDRYIGGRNLANKLWNASRFVMMQVSENDQTQSHSDLKNPVNKQIMDDLSELGHKVTELLETYQYGLATDLLHNFFWHRFCDEYLEAAKELMQSPETSSETAYTLSEALSIQLKLFHPFMPFVTEAIWQELLKRNVTQEPLLITAKWPFSSLQAT